MPSEGRSKPHVVVLIDYSGAAGGGAEVLATELTVGLDGARFRRTFCVLRWRNAGLPDEKLDAEAEQLAAAGVELLALERRSRWDLRAWRPLLRLLRSGDVDVLHSHKVGPNVWGSLLRRVARVPVFVAHEHTWSFEGQPLRRLLDRWVIAPACDAFVAVSAEDRRRMIAVEHIPPERIELVPNGIPPLPPPSGRDLRAELGIPADAPVVGTVAILRPQKALDVLLRACARVRDAGHPELRVVLAGDGPELDRLEALAAELGLGGRALFLGLRPDVRDLLDVFDVAASSSAFEGSPLAIIEYMAAGLPIAATRVGGVPDLVEDGREALLVEPGDPEPLATAIARLLDDRPFGRALGDAAQRRQAAELSLDRTVSAISDLYERLLERRGRADPGARARQAA